MTMSCALLHSVHIDFVYTSVPQKTERLIDELRYYGNSEKKLGRVRNIIGPDSRRIAWPSITAADLCRDAAIRLLREQDVDRGSIDALIFVTQTPDYDLPATACILQQTLSLSRHCAAFDVNQGCSGYIYGLWLAASLIASGACGRVLLLAGEAADYQRNPDNRIIAPIFGDGGSATLLSHRADAAPLSFLLGTDGAGFDSIIRPAGRARVPYAKTSEENSPFFTDIVNAKGTPWRLNEVYMDGPKVFEFTVSVIPAHIKQFMKETGITPNSVNWLILHQANKQIVEFIAEKSGFPLCKAPTETFSRYGNLSSASIPATLCDLFSEGQESAHGRILLTGYGVGLSWGSCLLESQDLFCTHVHTYTPPANLPGREALIKHWTAILQGKGSHDED